MNLPPLFLQPLQKPGGRSQPNVCLKSLGRLIIKRIFLHIQRAQYVGIKPRFQDKSYPDQFFL